MVRRESAIWCPTKKQTTNLKAVGTLVAASDEENGLESFET